MDSGRERVGSSQGDSRWQLARVAKRGSGQEGWLKPSLEVCESYLLVMVVYLRLTGHCRVRYFDICIACAPL